MWPDGLVTHPAFSGYRLRVAEPKLCDKGVKQYSGHLDNGWKASVLLVRQIPKCSETHTQPCLGSLNPERTQRPPTSFIGQTVGFRTRGNVGVLTNHSTGGSGCSPTTGLFFELGPCQIADETSVTYNKRSWNSHSNIPQPTRQHWKLLL